MIDLLCDHGPKDANIVCHFGVPWKEVTDPLTVLAILLEVGHRPLALELLTLELGDGLTLRE